jgi:phage tail-like protein
MLEGSFPRGTKVEFHYYISEGLLEENELRELPESKWENGLPGSSVAQGVKKRDALFQTESEGRYLWFRITLVGTEKLSPEVSSVTIFFPKVSYLEYLPSVYREDPANSNFLDRFLAIFESLFFEIDFTIDHLGRWFDAAGTPPEFLEWLGSWLAADQGRGESTARKKVSEAKQREFISRAVSMYRERGTRKGLEDLIFLYTGKKSIIVENLPAVCTKVTNGQDNRKNNKKNESQQRNNSKNENPKETESPKQKKFLFFPSEEATIKLPDGNGTEKKEISLHDILFGVENFSFCVLFEEKLEETDMELIREIIEEEKPAHTTYKIKVLEPWFCLDGHTYLGKNTRLRRPEFMLGKYSVLGRDTALGVEKRTGVARQGLEI